MAIFVLKQESVADLMTDCEDVMPSMESSWGKIQPCCAILKGQREWSRILLGQQDPMGMQQGKNTLRLQAQHKPYGKHSVNRM